MLSSTHCGGDATKRPRVDFDLGYPTDEFFSISSDAEPIRMKLLIHSVGIPSGIPYGIPKIDGIPFGIPNGTWYLGFPFRGLYLRYEDGIIGMDVYLPILCMDC